MFKKIKEAWKLYKYANECHSYIAVLELKTGYAATLHEKGIMNGKMINSFHHGKVSPTYTGAILSAVNIRNSHENKERDNDKGSQN